MPSAVNRAPGYARSADMNEVELDREIAMLRKRKKLIQLRQCVEYLELSDVSRPNNTEPSTSAQSTVSVMNTDRVHKKTNTTDEK